MLRTASLYRPGIIAFTITLLVGCVLSGAQFYNLYREELVGKGLDFSISALLVTYMTLVVFPSVLSLSMLAWGLFCGRAYFRSHRPLAFIRRFLVVVGCIGVLGFVYDSFCVSKANNASFIMLYSVRSAQNQRDFYKNEADNSSTFSDVSINSPEMLSIGQMADRLLELKHQKTEKQKNLIAGMAHSAGEQTIKAFLDTSHIRQYGLTMADFRGQIYGANSPGSVKDLSSYAEVYMLETKLADEYIARFDNAMTKKIFYPLILILLSISGFMLGYVFRKMHIAVPIIMFVFVFDFAPPLADLLINAYFRNYLFLAYSVYLGLLSIPSFMLYRLYQKQQLADTINDGSCPPDLQEPSQEKLLP